MAGPQVPVRMQDLTEAHNQNSDSTWESMATLVCVDSLALTIALVGSALGAKGRAYARKRKEP